MILQRLTLVNYKNLEEADLSFSPNINCFLGNNGMGKTNLLDAIYYLSFCRSYSNQIDSQNIMHEREFFMIHGYYNDGDKPEDIYCGVKRRAKKQFKRNKKEYDKLSDHIGLIPLVMVSPQDSVLLSGGSEERRKFIDIVISQFDKQYLDYLIKYNNALQQRNHLLKMDRSFSDESLFEVWEEQMSMYGEKIYSCRKSFIEKFTPVFNEFYDYISGSKEKVYLNYTSHIEKGNLAELLKEVRERDFILGYSSRGIHKDELEMNLGDYPIRKIGSQGQNKTYLTVLKLAQYEFLKKIRNTEPILLLDDIFDKLDSSRVEKIIKLVSGDRFGQIFITDTNRTNLDNMIKAIHGSYSFFDVKEGIITLSENSY